MSWEVHIDWMGQTRLVGHLHAAERSPAVSFEYASEWLSDAVAFAIDPTVFTAVSKWRQAARRFGIKPATLQPYSSAFEHKLMDEARREMRG